MTLDGDSSPQAMKLPRDGLRMAPLNPCTSTTFPQSVPCR